MAAKNLPTSSGSLPGSGWLEGDPKNENLPASHSTLGTGGWLNGSPKSESLVASSGALPSSGWLDGPSVPIVVEPVPIGAERVNPATTTLNFKLKQIKSIANIDINTLDVYFSFNNGAQVTAVINNVPQNGYSHSTLDVSTSLESVFYVEVTPPLGVWPENSEVDTYVEIEDTAP